VAQHGRKQRHDAVDGVSQGPRRTMPTRRPQGQRPAEEGSFRVHGRSPRFGPARQEPLRGADEGLRGRKRPVHTRRSWRWPSTATSDAAARRRSSDEIEAVAGKRLRRRRARFGRDGDAEARADLFAQPAGHAAGRSVLAASSADVRGSAPGTSRFSSGYCTVTGRRKNVFRVRAKPSAGPCS